MFLTKEMPSTNSNYTKSKSSGDICSKNYHNMSDEVGMQELLSDDSKAPNKNCDIGRVGNEMTQTEEMQSTNLNYTNSKSHGNNCNSNCDNDRVSSEG